MVESRRDPDAATRALSDDERAYITAARDLTFTLYEGVRTPHRSCGIALAETFGRATAPYQVLRRGGITGTGPCGALRAGEHILGELLGDPDPTGAVTPALRAAITWYQGAAAAIERGGVPDVICANLVRPHGDFAGPARVQFCTHLAASAAALTAEALCRFAPAAVRPPLAILEEP